MWYNCNYTDDFSFIENWEEDKKKKKTEIQYLWHFFLFSLKVMM